MNLFVLVVGRLLFCGSTDPQFYWLKGMFGIALKLCWVFLLFGLFVHEFMLFSGMFCPPVFRSLLGMKLFFLMAILISVIVAFVFLTTFLEVLRLKIHFATVVSVMSENWSTFLFNSCLLSLSFVVVHFIQAKLDCLSVFSAKMTLQVFLSSFIAQFDLDWFRWLCSFPLRIERIVDLLLSGVIFNICHGSRNCFCLDCFNSVLRIKLGLKSIPIVICVFSQIFVIFFHQAVGLESSDWPFDKFACLWFH